MSVLLSLAARQARLFALRDVIDDGGGALWFYAGAPPSTPEDATAETMLAAVQLDAVSGAVGAAGNVATLTLAVPRVNLVTTSGVTGWVRVVRGAGVGVMDLLVGLPNSATPVWVTALQLYAGGELQLVSFVLSE